MPSRFYLHSIHLCIHPRPPLSTDHPSIHPSNKQATNKPSNPNHATLFSPNAVDTWFALRGRSCALPPHSLPPIFTQIHPSIHPSTKHTNRKIAYPSSTVSRKRSRQANQATNAPKSYTFVLSMIHPSLYVFSPNPSNQQAKQAEPTDTPTKGSGIQKKG